MAKPNVGISEKHTPVKHAIMHEFVAKECRVANSSRCHYIERLVWIDLTAGDGTTVFGEKWGECCSPGILATQATKSAKPVTVALYEQNPDTYKILLNNLAAELPKIGYKQTAEDLWERGETAVRALNMDGRSVDATDEWTPPIGPKDVVLILNDPNSITQWAMNEHVVERVVHKAKGLRVLSCLGFNVAGIGRGPFDRPEGARVTRSISARSEWYGLIDNITQSLPDHHDLMLTAFDRDSSKWAYLFTTVDKWMHEEEALLMHAFNASGKQNPYTFAWYRRDGNAFTQLLDRLILQKTELEARRNPQLPFDVPTTGGPDPAQTSPTAATAST